MSKNKTKNLYRILSISLLLFVPLIFGFSNRFININSTNTNIPIISAVAPPPPFLRGLNFGNTLDAPNEGDWGIVMQEEHFDLAKEAGFECIRIPVRFSTHAEDTAPYTIDPVFMERVAWAVDNALSRDMIAIVDMHHYEEIHTNLAGHRDRYLGMWVQIAEYFQDYPDDLYLEFLNEPYGDIDIGVWNELVQETYDICRATNPTRTLVIGGQADNIFQMEYLELPDPNDRNILTTFHFYTPWQFAITGDIDWYGTDEEKAVIESELDFAAQWAADHNLPVLMGEFGSNPLNEMDQRTNWGNFVREAAEARNICWTYWHFQELYDLEAEAWHQELLDVLVPEPPSPPPSTPTGLTADALSPTKIDLNWNDNPESSVTRYNIYRSTTSGFTPDQNNLIDEAETSDYLDIGLNPDTIYYYRVTAVDAYRQESDPSSIVSDTTLSPDSNPPATPTGLSTTATSYNQIDLNWNDNSELDLLKYRIYRSTSSGFTPDNNNLISETLSSEFIDWNLNSETTYYYRVSAVDDSNNESPATSQQSATTLVRPAANIRVQYRCGDTNDETAQVRPYINIYNDDAEDLLFSDITVRYWFDSEHHYSNILNEIDYAVVGSTNIQSTFGSEGDYDYLEIGFDSSLGTVYSGSNTGEIQNRFHTSDWLLFDQTNDYSFDPSKTSYADWERVTAYYQGAIVWGIEPSGEDLTPPTITSPNDINYIEGDTGNSISWTANDMNPATYTITIDGTQVQSGSWNSGVPININVDGLNLGSYTYIIVVSDQSGLTTTDSVIVTVSQSAEFQNGDVNHDGNVDIIDALMIAQYYVGLDPQPFYPEEANVDDSGAIDIVDALMVAQAYVGLIELPS